MYNKLSQITSENNTVRKYILFYYKYFSLWKLLLLPSSSSPPSSISSSFTNEIVWALKAMRSDCYLLHVLTNRNRECFHMRRNEVRATNHETKQHQVTSANETMQKCVVWVSEIYWFHRLIIPAYCYEWMNHIRSSFHSFNLSTNTKPRSYYTPSIMLSGWE